ncbi:nucleoside diphosphate-linked moiety X motif 6-like [Argiope bruennichi]|uniref:nucleoside diphosphate-linked moiety X motif 6-like n=1 Tax=Argiope bruennichi TaxID=94029 RepID=UPI002494BB21|nr:nucleoside diphosphate-linked moiety X motif 6-like [Argiope bruennichi]
MSSATLLKKTWCLIKFLHYPLDFQLKHIRMASKSAELYGNFHAKTDIYKGLTIETQNLSLSDEDFENNLKNSLMDWIKTGIRGVWFKVNIANSSYVPILVKHGFLFHHAKTSYVMLTRWLPADEPNLLPQYPYTHIGVGGMVINDKNQVLTIQEKYHQTPHWKLPGGYSNPGEDFGDTARREVFEETGIESKFVSVVALRHHHKHIFSCSDIYIVCHLKPVNETITKSNEEIAKCEWMDIETYRNHPEVTEFNRFIMDAFLESQRLKTSIAASSVLSFRKDCYNKVYHVQSTNDS